MNSKYPLLKLIFFLTIGFLFSHLLSIDTYTVIILSILSLFLVFLSIIPNTFKYIVVAITLGIILNSNINLYKTELLDDKVPNTFEGVFKGEVTEVLTIKSNYKRFICEGVLQSNILTKSYNCKIITTLFDKENLVEIKPGYILISKSNFRVGQPKILKEDFNENNYLISKKCLFFSTTSVNNISILNKEYNYKTFLFETREEIKSKINNVIVDESIAGVMIALTTGDKSGIDKLTQEDFSLTGTAHVLAISGLHVGIFSFIIYTLLGFVRNRKVKFITFTSLLWFFVIFTGGQPSAIRAAIMASMAIYLIYNGKVPNPINILLSTTVLFVLIEPTIIYSISFQLSIFAITGIILLYKPFNSLILMLLAKENIITRFISSSFAISFAATIPTSFLTAYYFNTFSIIYPLANLLVLPLMTYAAIQSIFFVLFSAISLPFADLFAKSSYSAIVLTININDYLAQIGETNYLNNGNILYISILSSLVLLYILTSITLKRLLFRSMVSICIILLIFNIDLKNDDSIILLPREQYTGLIINSEDKRYIILADRKKYDYLSNDISLVNYISNLTIETLILKTGNVSINLHDQVKDLPKVKSKFISINKLDSLTSSLNNYNIYRINEIHD